MITQADVKELLQYETETGVFYTLNGKVSGGKNSKGYVLLRVKGEKHYAHRVAWLYVNGEWPVNQIDHINGIKSDNRIENLRQVTHQQNQFNKANQQSKG